jgi:hypothetical protein
MESNQSEVAALKARLDRECEAYRFFLNGFAVMASHRAITKRMESFSVAVTEIKRGLLPLLGEEEATTIIGKAFQEKLT